ncbi:FixH family protein [Bradyrhizobium sp. CIR3A]|uniref:FixH family protein n=1 Tax=Bradyrhizobium sp. CIR3A TaxID=2663838 RepID=UPI0016060C38|nr:FixH family protein [Bradyrhizobium sp. CIR3A]MBB4261360.1 hypothetical protein [Bradyrhizobium sp. CIR3A]
MNRILFSAAVAAFLVWSDQAKAEMLVGWALSKSGMRFEYEALIRLKDSGGTPVNGARIEIDIDMPSMPMMHKIPRVTAVPGQEPGVYHANFKVEMAGAWAARIEVDGSVRASVVKRFKVE